MKLESLYDIESELVKAFPKMIEAAEHPDLKDSFSSHLGETRGHILSLGKAFEMLGHKPAKIKVMAVRGLVKDLQLVIKKIKTENARITDTALISAASYIENYEIAGYISAVLWATELGHTYIAGLLGEILSNEIAAHDKLTRLASGTILHEAHGV